MGANHLRRIFHSARGLVLGQRGPNVSAKRLKTEDCASAKTNLGWSRLYQLS